MGTSATTTEPTVGGGVRRLLAALVLAILTVTEFPAGPAPAQSDPLTPSAAVERLFVAGAVEADWFAPEFLAQVPAAQVAAIVRDLAARFGGFRSVDAEGSRLTVRLASANVPVRVGLDADGRIVGLLFGTPVAVGSIDDHVAAITALPGRTAVLVVSSGSDVAAHQAEQRLAVGSVAKLAVMAALDEAVAAGRISLADAVPLDAGWRSLPTGILQDWPQGTPVTVATLAGLAISLSDNTATDGLIAILGREAVEAVTPRNTPFPTTRELFVLKAAGAHDLRTRWRNASPGDRREILAGLAARPLPAPSGFAPEVTADIEWFLSARETCALLEATATMPVLGINPGLAERADWGSIAYKGGSETGVLALATRLVDDTGTAHCVVAVWNDVARLDEARLYAPYRGIVQALKSGSLDGTDQ